MHTYKYDWINELRTSTAATTSSNILINEQLSYDSEEETTAYRSQYAQFNDEQKTAFDTIISAIETTPDQLCYFLHGPAGTGKTFVYNTIANYFRGQNKIVLCVASSGIAALLLTGGRTSHSRFNIPLKPDNLSTCFMPRGSPIAELIKNTSLIIWDEVPMQNKYCFEAVDRTLRDVMENDFLFGGIPVIFGGDFAQIPPVVKYGDRSELSMHPSDSHTYGIK